MKIYHIDSSARKAESVSKSLAKLLVEKIKKPQDTVTYRDVSSGLPFVSGIKGGSTPKSIFSLIITSYLQSKMG